MTVLGKICLHLMNFSKFTLHSPLLDNFKWIRIYYLLIFISKNMLLVPICIKKWSGSKGDQNCPRFTALDNKNPIFTYVGRY